MARNTVTLIGLAFVLVLSSCADSAVYLRVLEGNYAFSRGDYMTANLDYIRAEREMAHLPRIHYNVGNVYHALGESDAALEKWQRAENREDEELLYRIAFNRGVLYYERGNYQEAYRAFRRALKFSPDDVEAKVNLEYALRKQALEEGEPEPPASASGEEPPVSDDGKRILEYVKRSAPTTRSFESKPVKEEEVKDW